MKESEVQVLIIDWCNIRLKADVAYWSIPNERQPKHLSNLKKMGLKEGAADLMFFYKGQLVCIEVKRPTTFKIGKRGRKIVDQRGGVISTAQIEFRSDIIAADGAYYLVDNLDDFITIMCRWDMIKPGYNKTEKNK